MASIPAAAPSEGHDTTDEREEARASGHGEAHVDPRVAVPPTSPSETSSFLVGKYLRVGDNFWRAFAVFGVLTILGIIGVVMRLSGGIGDKVAWGYYVAMFSFMLTTASAAPMVAIAPRLANAHWRRPLSRAAEMWSAVGLLSLLWFIPILWVLPPLSDGRRSLWFFDKADPNAVPSYSPHIWTSAAILALVILGLAMLWLSSLPDFASVAKRAPDGSRQKRWAKRMALGWQGTSAQWFMMKHRLGILGALYFMMLVFVHFLVSVDFLMTLVPGWIDALYPITHAANALQAAAATMVLTAWVLRTFCGYERYIGLDQIWGLGKLMFALSLLWFWFWFSSFNVLWYGKKPYEQAVIDLLFTGPYLWIFMATFMMCFVIPLWTLMWNPVRRSLWGPPLLAVVILAGTFLDRVRLYVAAYSVEGIGNPNIHKEVLDLYHIPKAHYPDLWDVFIMLGAIGATILVYMVATRLFPIMNFWEQRELQLYDQGHVENHRGHVRIMGKSE